MSKQEFVRIITAEQPEAPEDFTYDAVLNAKERPALEQTMEKAVAALNLDTVLESERGGAQILDTRLPIDFAAAHLTGSINIPLSGKFTIWAGTLLNPKKSIVLVTDIGSETESATQLGRIGFDRIAGFLADGMRSLDAHPDLTGSFERITAGNLNEELLDDAPFVLDVRSESEWIEQRIEGSYNVPLKQLRERIDEIPTAVRLVTQCRMGYRSSIAASMLAKRGYARTLDLVGGIEAWCAAGYSTVDDRSAE